VRRALRSPALLAADAEVEYYFHAVRLFPIESGRNRNDAKSAKQAFCLSECCRDGNVPKLFSV
jgi:hypothetical protein